MTGSLPGEDQTVYYGNIVRGGQCVITENCSGAAFTESRDVVMSFEANLKTATKIYYNHNVTVTKIRGIVMKQIAGTDDGTIQGANSAGDSAGGLITATASDALNVEYAVAPTTNNTVVAGSYYLLTSAKSTSGGTVLVTVESVRT